MWAVFALRRGLPEFFDNKGLEMAGENARAARVYAILDAAGISYEKAEHPAVFTIEEMDTISLPHPEAVLKNLFLQDAKEKRRILVSLPGHKRADLTALGEQLGCKLSFGSEKWMKNHLGLDKGSVTPLGIINDEEQKVEVFFDEEIKAMPLVGVHPNQNTATVFLKPDDLAALIQGHDNPFQWIKL